ncbi:MAG: hypothetical protein A4E57_02760 [Syntrophorhabdaceae bacterium PtaU1.Bin034]|nr:MAG: hypothetical protein A4E57_02760 [Syntrophorhabdaceae bacterium PtaU1.Bin034]
MALNAVAPATVAMARPPGTCPTNLYAAPYSLFAIPALYAICPIRTNKGMTVKLYAVRTSYISTATRLKAEPKPLRMPNPTKPTIAIAKPNSMPVRNSIRSITSAAIPRKTSFILPSRNLHDIGDQHQTLDYASKSYSEYDRVKRQLEGR